MSGHPEPYYEDDSVTIYHGDCREILPDLLGGGFVDVMVTDPPYGMAYVSNSSKYGSTEPIAGDDDTSLRDDVLAVWGSRPALVFGTWRVPRPEARALVVWDKGDSPGMGDLAIPWGPSHEEIYVCGDGWQATTRRAGVIRIRTLGAMDSRRPDHPTPKPVALMVSLIECCPPGVIVDPFAGSGSTLRAAKDLGRRAIGIEVSERYCDVIAGRLAQEVLDFGQAAA